MMKKHRQSEVITITGHVVDSEWGMNDQAMGISIQTDNDEYFVDLRGPGEELVDLIDVEVEATGIVRNLQDGSKMITIMDYEAIRDDRDVYSEGELYDQGDGCDGLWKEWL